MRIQHAVDVRDARPETTRSISARPNSSINALGQYLLERQSARSEVDVAAFRCPGYEAAVDVRQQRDAKTGSRGNQRDISERIGCPS